MTITSITLIPSNVTYTATSAGVQLPATNFVRPGKYGAPNPDAIVAPTWCPGDITNSRHTLAVDISFDEAYLAQPFHCGLISRFKGTNYTTLGDNRGGAIIFGEEDGWYRIAALEEIEIVPGSNGVRSKVGAVLQPNRLYRAVIDTIFLNGNVALEGRLVDKVTGQLVYNTGTVWSSHPHNYDPARQTSAFFNIISPGAAGTVWFNNMKSHWSDATEYVANP